MEVKERKIRSIKYSKYVKQVHLPARSVKKEREMLQLISQTRPNIREKVPPNKNEARNHNFFNRRNHSANINYRPTPDGLDNLKLPPIIQNHESQNGS